MAIDPSAQTKTPNKSTQSTKSEDSGELSPSSTQGGNPKFIKIVIYTMVIIVSLVAVVLVIKTFRDKNEVSSASSITPSSLSQENTESQPQQEVSNDSEVSDKPWLQVDQTTPSKPTTTSTPVEGGAGIKDISGDTVKTNVTPVSKDTFVKDLKGNTVAEKYDISNISTVVDFISYKKKRAVTGAGVELYWLDANYKGVPAKVQVPFKIFKELDNVGITVVDVEVVEIDKGDGKVHQIATNFTVRPDYKEILDNR